MLFHNVFKDFITLMRLRRAAPATAFRTAVKAHHDMTMDFPIRQLTNGLVETSTLYYAIAQDTNNGKINIYWSRAQKYLKTTTNKNGTRTFIDDEFRYHWDTLPKNSSKIDIRNSISAHHKHFRQFGVNHMAMNGGDFSDIYANKKDPNEWNEVSDDIRNYRYKIYGYQNEDFALAVHENPTKKGGGWSLKIYAPYEKLVRGKSFVEIDGVHKHQWLMSTIFTSGSEYATYKTPEEALANMYMIMNDRLQLTWQGRAPIRMRDAMITNTTTKAYSFFAKEAKNPENVEEAEWDGGIALAAGVIARGAFALSFSWSIAIAIGGGFAMRKGLQIYKGAKKEISWIRKKAFSVHPERAPYIKATKDNMRRPVNTKPNEESTEFVDVLNGCDLDITHDDEKQTSPRQRNWKARWLHSYSGKAFSHKGNYIDSHTSTSLSFNGLLRLVRRDPKTGSFITYSRYVEALDINDSISIPQDIKDLLKNGEIIKTEQIKERRTISSKAVSIEELEDDILPNLFNGYASVPAAAKDAACAHIKWLFTDKTEENGDSDHKAKNPPKAKKNAIKLAFGSHDTEMHAPSAEMISFFKGCIMPYASLVRNPSN